MVNPKGRGKGTRSRGKRGRGNRGRVGGRLTTPRAVVAEDPLAALLNEMRDVGIKKSDHYGFPASVLAYIRSLVPGDIVGEIREDAYPVSIQEFCTAMDIPKLQ
ncbi:hypothetical protein AC249_AIPGENE22616 [Exaiptasia diaphana]|nr:hypothetical protein AC249_AIPGENE22616 [Exaiptasia diaphana]